MSDNGYSVYQWFPDGSYEKVRAYVSLDEAVKAARFYTSNVASRIGITQKVMITDGDDCCIFEWRNHEGIVHPPELCETHKEDK